MSAVVRATASSSRARSAPPTSSASVAVPPALRVTGSLNSTRTAIASPAV